MTTEEFQEWCKVEFQAVHAALKNVDESLRGNGKKGIKHRVDTLEEYVGTRKRLEWVFIVVMVGLVGSYVKSMVWGG